MTLQLKNQPKELNWKLSMPFIKHVCSVVQNYEIWLCSTDANIELGGKICITTTIDGKQSKKRYLKHAHVSGNLITIEKSLVIIGGRNRRHPGEKNIIALEKVEFCDEGMSY